MDVTRRNPELISLFFNRGAFVTWQDVTENGLGQPVTRHGIIECERSDRPGWYYVRNEHGDLEQLQWQEMALARRTDERV